MAFDYKKEYKEFYLPPRAPHIVEVPEANYVAVRGGGDPNEEDGEYKRAVGLLYAVSFTIKMSPRSGLVLDGWFDCVVPPLEGFWEQDGVSGFDPSRKADFSWISVIRLPDFVTREAFERVKAEVETKKKLDCSAVEFLTVNEGLCVQMLHIGAFDDEVASVALMDEYIAERGYANDITSERLHHEIYLSDARRTEPAKLKTVIRHPIKKL